MIWSCFRPVTVRNKSVMVDFDRHRPLLSSISLAATRKREKKREPSTIGEPQDGIVDKEILARRRLLRCNLLV
ncbi:hypothetical protein B296_00057894 [Ensete ventricosum]|uniref:Uncharacterized protein n=1 Tax=Ensete ventricosum TaxID=4639 RepID=A0A426XH01_ENSVE|nr:hypothetical protein B296_00057894 [Ensete ventricosum]